VGCKPLEIILINWSVRSSWDKRAYPNKQNPGLVIFVGSYLLILRRKYSMSIFLEGYTFGPLDGPKFTHLMSLASNHTLKDKDLLRLWAYEVETVQKDRVKASRIFRAAERLYIEERKRWRNEK